jgi:LysR family glycine cleavage system transcriptional activator
LARQFSVALRLSKTYWIVGPKAIASLTKIVAFRDWLIAQAADDATRLKMLSPGL